MTERDKAPVRVGTWPTGRTSGLHGSAWSGALAERRGRAVQRLHRWFVVDTAPGRLLPWLPVAFGLGIAIYFTAEREPALWAALSLAVLAAAVAFVARRRAIAFPILLGLAAAAAGFAAATVKSARIAHPVLWHVAGNADVSGWVIAREERERSDRIVVQVHGIDGRRMNEAPERIRVSVRKGTAPGVGSFVRFKARLNPPPPPLLPGGYDFARDLWFQGIGATGFVLGRLTLQAPPTPPSRWLRYAAFIESIRDGLDRRIRSVLAGDAGAIASALITGKRDAISAPVNEAMYVSSLAHVLSISGYHMAVVAGVVFFVVRGAFALIPGIAMRRPIKKWAALTAIVASACYLVLSGAEVATQRAFIMTAVVLGGVLVDRPALTLRTLAVAAMVVMLVAPQAIVHPSFQMSFAATLALVAAYEKGLPWMSAGAKTSLGARVALWGGREIAALVFASVVAGLATMLYAAYHFHRIAPYGVLANLLGMPIVSAFVMPSGLLALVAMPFGFDGIFWTLMGEGIGWMIAVTLWVASLPGALGRVTAFGVGPLLLGTAGLVVLALLRSPLRWSGGLIAALAVLIAVRTPAPDLLIAQSADAVAVRGADGRLSIMQSGTDAFAARAWLRADADARAPGDPGLREGVRCDDAGCVARAADGAIVALAISAAALDDDCARASLVVTRRPPPSGCAATVIDRAALQNSGALAFSRTGGRWVLNAAARPPTHERPWLRQAQVASAATSAAPTATPRPAQRDATPRVDDLEPEDFAQ